MHVPWSHHAGTDLWLHNGSDALILPPPHLAGSVPEKWPHLITAVTIADMRARARLLTLLLANFTLDVMPCGWRVERQEAG